MVTTRIKQTKAEKNVVMSTNVSPVETLLSIEKGSGVEYSVFDFGIEQARSTAYYLKKRGKGVFAVSKTSPTTFVVTRLV